MNFIIIARAVGASPCSHLHEKIFVSVPVLRGADSINYRIDDSGRPCQNGCHNVQPRPRYVLLEDIDNHKGKEAHDKTQKDDQHHDCQSKIIFIAKEFQL